MWKTPARCSFSAAFPQSAVCTNMVRFPRHRQNTTLYLRVRARRATLLRVVQAARDRESAVLRFAVPVVFPAGLADSIRSARVVAIIPARYQSTRLPGKPLALIAGRPMIEHVYRRARRGAARRRRPRRDRRRAHRRRRGRLRRHGRDDARAITPPAPTGWPKSPRALDGEIVVNVQGDEPLIDADAIDAAVQLLLDRPDDQMATLRRRIDDAADLANPSVVKVVDRSRGLRAVLHAQRRFRSCARASRAGRSGGISACTSTGASSC